MKKIKIIIFLILYTFPFSSFAYSETFDEWKINFSKYAASEGVSNKTLSIIIKNLRFLPKVIEYDRYQPEFYEDTKTYVEKRANKKK